MYEIKESAAVTWSDVSILAVLVLMLSACSHGQHRVDASGADGYQIVQTTSNGNSCRVVQTGDKSYRCERVTPTPPKRNIASRKQHKRRGHKVSRNGQWKPPVDRFAVN